MNETFTKARIQLQAGVLAVVITTIVTVMNIVEDDGALLVPLLTGIAMSIGAGLIGNAVTNFIRASHELKESENPRTILR